MSILRKIFVLGLVVLFFAIAAIFAYSNPDPIAVDIGFVRFESVSMALAFACAFALGWLFGLITAAIAVLRMRHERQRLRRDLRIAETEVSTLRSLPMNDAN